MTKRNASEYINIIGILHPDVCVYERGGGYADLVWGSTPIDQAVLDAEIDEFQILQQEVEDPTQEMLSAGAYAIRWTATLESEREDLEFAAEEVFRSMLAVKARNLKKNSPS